MQKTDKFFLESLPPKSGRCVVLAIETTGLNQENSNIIELAAIEIINALPTGRQFHVFFRPRFPISDYTLKTNQLTQDFFKENYENVFKSESECWKAFIYFVKTSKIFIHNAPAMINFINNDLKFWKLKQFPMNQFRCTMKIFTKYFFPDGLRWYFDLEFCLKHLNLETPSDKTHSALTTCFMTTKVVHAVYENDEKISTMKLVDNDLKTS